MWFVYAFLSALFAALTSVLAKVGVDGVNSNLATAIRTTVILVLAWGIVWMTGTNKQLALVSPKSWTFLILSGLTTGGSWLFFYKALQMGTVSRVVSVDKFSVVLAILSESVAWQRTDYGGRFVYGFIGKNLSHRQKV